MKHITSRQTGTRLHPAAVLLALTMSAAPARAAFQTPYYSPRTAILGTSALAAGPEPTALFLNPAGMTRLGGPELYLAYDKLYAGMAGADGMGIGSMAIAAPTRLGTVGAGLGSFTAPGLAHERTIALGFARDINERVRLGIAAKQLEHGFSTDGDARAERDPVFAKGKSKSAFGVDLGVIALLSEPMRLSFSVRNINRPDVGLGSVDRVPMDVDGGLAFQLPRLGLKLTADAAYRQNAPVDGLPVIPKIGFEKAVAEDKVLIRGSLSSLDFSAGFGLQLGRIGFDYALVIQRNLVADSLGSHRIGMSYRFGSDAADARLKADRPSRPTIQNTTIRQNPIKTAGNPNRDWMYSIQ